MENTSKLSWRKVIEFDAQYEYHPRVNINIDRLLDMLRTTTNDSP